MSFTSDMQAYAKKTGLSMDKAVISVCTQASASIIERSPIDTGRFKGNWFASIDSVDKSTSETRTKEEALQQATAMALKASGHIFNLTNNLPYAYRLEYEHWSNQAPNGMVRLTAEETKQALKRFAK